MNQNTDQSKITKDSLKFLFLCFSISRILVFSVIGLVSYTYSYLIPARDEPILHSISNLDFNVALTHFKNILLSADASWYLEIAKYGYPIQEYTDAKALHWVFFPLFPILIKVFSFLCHSNLFGALLLNFLCLLTSLLIIRKYLQTEGLGERSTKLVIALICFNPLSYFLSTPHTESIFLLCLSASLLFLQKKSLGLSSIAFGLCIISRPTGLLIAPGIALIAKKRGLPVVLFSALSSTPFLGYCAFLWETTGNPLAWLHNQTAWGRKGTFIDLFNFGNFSIENLVAPWSLNILHTIFLILLLIVVILQIRNKTYGFLLITLVPVLSALSSGTVLSISRLIMPLVILPITLVQNLKDETILLLLLAYSFLLGLMTLLYALRVSFAMA